MVSGSRSAMCWVMDCILQSIIIIIHRGRFAIITHRHHHPSSSSSSSVVLCRRWSFPSQSSNSKSFQHELSMFSVRISENVRRTDRQADWQTGRLTDRLQTTDRQEQRSNPAEENGYPQELTQQHHQSSPSIINHRFKLMFQDTNMYCHYKYKNLFEA